MWGHGRQRAGQLVLIASIGLVCCDASGQIDAARPMRLDSLNSVQSLAPAALPVSDSPAVELATSPLPADDATVTPYRNDAAINDLAFVDGRQGWAVGDAGVIWHTIDGGRHWLQQASGVTCRLRSVQFVDAKNGWAAGGRTAPYTHLTTGVLLPRMMAASIGRRSRNFCCRRCGEFNSLRSVTVARSGKHPPCIPAAFLLPTTAAGNGRLCRRPTRSIASPAI